MSLITLAQSAYDIACSQMSTQGKSSDPIDSAMHVVTGILNPSASSIVTTGTIPSIASLGLMISADGIVELGNYEACSNEVYLDSGGVRTVGLGLTQSDIPDLNSWAWDKSITVAEAVELFLVALQKYDRAVTKAVTRSITQAQHDALVSITYNIGISGMQNSTFIKRVNAGSSPEDVAIAMSWWDQDGGKVVRGLQNRRRAEGLVYTTGQYQNDGTVAQILVNHDHKPIYKGRINITQYIN